MRMPLKKLLYRLNVSVLMMYLENLVRQLLFLRNMAWMQKVFTNRSKSLSKIRLRDHQQNPVGDLFCNGNNS